MALKKTKTTKAGYDVEYWRVSPSIHVDMVDRTATTVILPYKDAAARLAKRPTIRLSSGDIEGYELVRQVEIGGADFEAAIVTGELRDAMYAQLKKKDFFVGSEDV
jgi:hypothetical protein